MSDNRGRSDDDVKTPGRGNWLGKQRRNFYLTNRCWRLMHELALDIGVSHGTIIELAVREMYARIKNEVPPIAYSDYRRPR